MNILVLEDNPSHLKLAHLVLSAAGNKVSDTATAEQALAAIRRDKPQIILLDLKLPGADGLSLVRKLKASPTTGDIRVVAVTAFPDLWSKTEALKAGCDAYILKPIDTRSLATEISHLAGDAPSRKPTRRRKQR